MGPTTSLYLRPEVPSLTLSLKQENYALLQKKVSLYQVSPGGAFRRRLEVSNETIKKVSLKTAEILQKNNISSEQIENLSLNLTKQRLSFTVKDPSNEERVVDLFLSQQDLQKEIQAIQEEAYFQPGNYSAHLKGDLNQSFALNPSERLQAKIVSFFQGEEKQKSFLTDLLEKKGASPEEIQEKWKKFEQRKGKETLFKRAIEKKLEEIEREVVFINTPAAKDKTEREQELRNFLLRIENLDPLSLLLALVSEGDQPFQEKKAFLEKALLEFLGEGKWFPPKTLSKEEKTYIQDVLAMPLDKRKAEEIAKTTRQERLEELFFRSGSVEELGLEYVEAHLARFLRPSLSKEIRELLEEEVQQESLAFSEIVRDFAKRQRDLSEDESSSSEESFFSAKSNLTEL